MGYEHIGTPRHALTFAATLILEAEYVAQKRPEPHHEGEIPAYEVELSIS